MAINSLRWQLTKSRKRIEIHYGQNHGGDGVVARYGPSLLSMFIIVSHFKDIMLNKLSSLGYVFRPYVKEDIMKYLVI